MNNVNLDKQFIYICEDKYEIKSIDACKKLDEVNNFVECEEEYEITNTVDSNESSISDTNSE
jgi:hypothetical protein